MLTRALIRAAAILTAAAAVTGLWVTPAQAGGGPGGVFGDTQCGQSYTPGCQVTAGTNPGGGGTAVTAAGACRGPDRAVGARRYREGCPAAMRTEMT